MNEITTGATGTALTTLDLCEQQIINQCKIQAQSFTETGRLLKQIKDGEIYKAKGFDSFKNYMDNACENTFPFKTSQAYKYIRIFEGYGNRLGNYEGVSLEILDMFKNFNSDDLEEIATENDLTSITVKEAEEIKRKFEDATRQLELFEDENEKLSAKVKELENREIEVIVQEPSEKQIDELVEQRIKSYKDEISELKDTHEKSILQLIEKNSFSEGEKRRAESATENALKMKGQIELENQKKDELIDKLKNELEKSSSKADEEMIMFKFRLSELQTSLSSFVSSLDEIEDVDKKIKFKSAAKKFIKSVLEDMED